MSRMFDPEFDPLQELKLTQGELAQQRATMNQLIISHNEQARLIMEMSEQMVKLTEQQMTCQEGILQIMERIEGED